MKKKIKKESKQENKGINEETNNDEKTITKNNEHGNEDDYDNDIRSEKSNHVFIGKYVIDQKNFPVYVLFKKEQQDKPVSFNNTKITADQLLQFVKKELDLSLFIVWFIKEGLEEYNEIVTNFSILSKAKQLEKITFAEKEMISKNKESSSNPDGKCKSANVYFTIMKRIAEKGNNFLIDERAKIKNILDKGKLKEEIKLNILTSF